jgi:hypothetical protein
MFVFNISILSPVISDDVLLAMLCFEETFEWLLFVSFLSFWFLFHFFCVIRRREENFLLNKKKTSIQPKFIILENVLDIYIYTFQWKFYNVR